MAAKMPTAFKGQEPALVAHLESSVEAMGPVALAPPEPSFNAKRRRGSAPPGAWRFFFAVLRNRPSFALGYFLVLLTVFEAVFAPLLAPYDPILANPVNYLMPPSWRHLMGTDSTGMDIFSRVIFAPRIDLTIAVIGTPRLGYARVRAWRANGLL